MLTENKQVSVLFVDVCDSTSLLQYADPEESRDYLGKALDLLVDAVETYGGTISQLLGDGLVALFGAPLAQEDHALRACRARKWLSELARSSLMVTAKRVLEGKKNSSICEAVAIAFSFAGLAKLGVRETSRHPFPTPFRSGMGSALRESLLRDIPRQQWRWSDVEGCTGRQTVLSSPIGGCQMQSRKCRPLIKMRFAPSRPLKTARAPSRMASCMSLSAFAMALRNL